MVGNDSSVRVIQDIVPGDVGTQWATVSYDARKALILSKTPDDRVIVFDLDTAAVVKSCQAADGTNLAGQWLVDSPSRGLIFAGFGTGRLSKQLQLLGMIMDATVPCENSFAKLDTGEMKYANSNGFTGVDDVLTRDATTAYLDSDGNLGTKWLTVGPPTNFGYKVPAALFSDMRNPAATILINNRQILGLLLVQKTTRRFLVLRKSDNIWHKVPDPSPGRAFGNFIGSPEAHSKDASMPESAGKAEWRIEQALTGPSVLGRFRLSSWVYPGILHLYDAATEKSYSITTDQGDSEILLVENGTVYYRVSDRLFVVPILRTGVGAPKLLATDELIRDAHWAFLKH